MGGRIWRTKNRGKGGEKWILKKGKGGQEGKKEGAKCEVKWMKRSRRREIVEGEEK